MYPFSLLCLKDMDKPIYRVVWDYLEDCYLDDKGNTYKTLEDIPQRYRKGYS
jgi:hypothetical protein